MRNAKGPHNHTFDRAKICKVPSRRVKVQDFSMSADVQLHPLGRVQFNGLVIYKHPNASNVRPEYGF